MSHFPDRAEAAPRPPLAIASSSTVRDRRHDNRRSVQARATLLVLDGPGAGARHDIVTRDQCLGGVSFLLRDPLAVGQNCRIEILGPGGIVRQLAEVIRSRPLSNGRHEMAVQFRKAV
jgi:hypothetical protein